MQPPILLKALSLRRFDRRGPAELLLKGRKRARGGLGQIDDTMKLEIGGSEPVWPLRLPSGAIEIGFWEGAMSPKEFKKLKEAAEKIRLENDTPEKARAFLIKIGYLNPDGQVAERFR
jgi:hypothetical protein